MNQALIKYLTVCGVGLAGCLGFVTLSKSMARRQATQKIKDRNWNTVLDNIAKSLDHAKQEQPYSVQAVADRLKGFLELYSKDHPSQAEYFQKYIGQLDRLSGDEYDYTSRIKQIRIIISELKKPITNQ